MKFPTLTNDLLKSRFTWAGLVLVLVLGTGAGLGSYTFQYAEGLSYFSKDPAACKNCHIMEPQFNSWQKSSHHTVATCVDCHLPHDFIGKYIAKAEKVHFRGFSRADYDQGEERTDFAEELYRMP